MALKKDIKITNAAANSLLNPNKQIFSDLDINVTLDSTLATAVLAVGYPLGYNENTGNYGPWMAPDPSVTVLTLNSRTGGTWGITINGIGVANTVIAWNATAAVVAATLLGLGYKATVTLAAKVYTITWDDASEVQDALPTVVIDLTQFTGGSADATQVTTAGNLTYGTDEIRGLVNPEQAQTGITTGDLAFVVLTGTDTVCTATQDTPHGLTTGMSLTMSGATETKLNITATITVTTDYAFTYTVAAVSGGTTDTGEYTTTNDVMVVMMAKGTFNYIVPYALVATGDQAALLVALKKDLVTKGLIVQGVPNRY